MTRIVRPDVETLAQAAADRILMAAEAAIADRGQFTLSLAGGSTPAALYRLLATHSYIERLDWSATDVFFGDERCVPPDHKWSNYAMAWETLLRHVPLAPDRIHRIPGELLPEAAAETYILTLARIAGPGQALWPRLDVILLGMGDDGHTASLFPDMDALTECNATVVATEVPSYVRPQVARVTLTLPVLNAGREVIFLVSGEGKAAMIKQVFAAARSEESENKPAPAALVRPSQGQLTWFLDEAAASQLQGV